jgi:hypothetical protein
MSSGIISFYRHWFCLTFFDNCLTYTCPSVPGGSGSRLFLGLKEKFFFFPTNYESLASHFVLSSKYHKPTTIQKSQKVYLGVRRDSPPHVRNSESLNKTTQGILLIYICWGMFCLSHYKSKRIVFYIYIYIKRSKVSSIIYLLSNTFAYMCSAFSDTRLIIVEDLKYLLVV